MLGDFVPRVHHEARAHGVDQLTHLVDASVTSVDNVPVVLTKLKSIATIEVGSRVDIFDIVGLLSKRELLGIMFEVLS